jgi:hypothetical protein
LIVTHVRLKTINFEVAPRKRKESSGTMSLNVNESIVKEICHRIEKASTDIYLDFDEAILLRKRISILENQLQGVQVKLRGYKQSIIAETHRDDLEFLDEVIADCA